MNDSPMSRYGIYILFLLAMLPVLLLRDFTPANELRYISIAADALRDGNFLTFTNQGLPYADKPPLYLWLVMGAYRMLGTDCMWLLGLLFSAVPAIVVSELTIGICGERIPGPRRTAFVLMLLTGALFISMSVTLRMDMLMTMFIVWAIWLYMQILRDRRGDHLRGRQWMVGVVVFLALFTKGPLGVLIPLIALIVFLLLAGDISRFGRYWGWRCWAVLLGGCLLWWGGAWLEGGREYIDNLLFHQTVGRAVDAFDHSRPWYYYLVQMWWCLAPWALLMVPVLLATLAGAGRDSRSPEQMMCLAVVVPTLILISCISSKLAVYMLPVVPFWTASLFMATDAKGSGWQRVLLGLSLAIVALGGLAGAAAVWLSQGGGRWLPYATQWQKIWVSCAGASLLFGCGIGVLRMFGRKASMDSGVCFAGFGLLATLLFGGLAIPAFNHMLGFDKVGHVAAGFSADLRPTAVVTLDMPRSENLDVYLGRPVTSIPIDSVSGYLDKAQGSVMVICRQGDMAGRPEASICRICRIDDKEIYYIPYIPENN